MAVDPASQRLAAALAREDWGGAERILRQWAKKKSAPAAVFYNLAQVLVRAGKAEQAGAWYRKALTLDPRHADAWCELGAWRAERGEAVEAAEAYARALALRPNDADALRGAARTAMRLGDWDRAKSHWRALAGDAADPTDDEAAIGLLRVALETGSPEAEALRRGLSARPDLRPQLVKALTRTARGALPLDPKDL